MSGETKDIGQVAYEAYCANTNNKSLATGDDLPKWDNLSTNIQDAWQCAAEAVADVSGGPQVVNITNQGPAIQNFGCQEANIDE